MSVNDTSAPAYTNEPEYKAIVARCKAICASISGKQWELGDEADTATQKWGETSLEQLAADINFDGAPCTLGRCRDVCRAWPKNRARARFFSSAKILATHPDRWGIVERNPDISKSEARELMRKLRAERRAEQAGATTQTEQADGDLADDDQADEDRLEEDGENTEPTATTEEDDIAATSQANTSTAATAKGAKAKRAAKEKQQQEQEDEWLRDNRRWFRDLVAAANEASRVAGMMDLDDEEQLNKLLPAVNPGSLMYVRGAGRMLFRVANRLAELLEVDLEEASAPIDRAHPAASAQTAA
jgi:hypothetical protein